MHIDWSSFLAIAVVAAAAALAVVLLVAFALVGLSASSGHSVAASDHGTAAGTRPPVGTTVAVLCVLAAALIVCYGLYLLIA
jgi:hypothetical protein